MHLRPQRASGLLCAGGLLWWGAACGGSAQAPRADAAAQGDAGLGDVPPADTDGAAPVSTPCTIDALVGAKIGSANSTGWPQVGGASADFDWKQGPFAAVKLVVDLDTSCYPFEKWAANPPPP